MDKSRPLDWTRERGAHTAFQCKQGHCGERVGMTWGQDRPIFEKRSVPDVQRTQQKHKQSWDREMGRVEIAPKGSTEELGVSDLCTLGELHRNSNSESAKTLYRFQGFITGFRSIQTHAHIHRRRCRHRHKSTHLLLCTKRKPIRTRTNSLTIWSQLHLPETPQWFRFDTVAISWWWANIN